MRLAAALLVALLALAGCTGHQPNNLGAAVSGAARPVSALAQASSGLPVVVSGKMVQKCPVAGCWFVLRDESGTIKVDTKNAGFAVLDVPLNSQVVVAGRLVVDGANRLIDATGVRY